MGVAVFVSSGDQGAAVSDYGKSYATHGITVSGFTSTPYDVSVGGTDFGDTYAGTNSTYWNSTNRTLMAQHCLTFRKFPGTIHAPAS